MPFSRRVSGSAFISQYHSPSCLGASGLVVGMESTSEVPRVGTSEEVSWADFATVAVFGLPTTRAGFTGGGVSFLGVDAAAAWREDLLLGAGSESASAGSQVMSRFLGGGIAFGLAARRWVVALSLCRAVKCQLVIGYDEAVLR